MLERDSLYKVVVMARLGGRWLVLAMIALLCGCAVGATSDPTGIDSGGLFGTGGAVGGAGAAGMGAGGPATFTRVWNEVISVKGCTNAICHGGMPGQGNLSMPDIGTAYLHLVNIPAAGDRCGPSMKLRVTPGNPAMSLLVEKLSSAKPSCGDTMPAGAGIAPACTIQAPTSCNSMAEIQLVKDWIMAGAMND
jgi:hypothetical protein